MMMPKPSLFAEEERGNRREKLGDPLVGLAKHVDFTALAARMKSSSLSGDEKRGYSRCP
jgi:hypothetical protein